MSVENNIEFIWACFVLNRLGKWVFSHAVSTQAKAEKWKHAGPGREIQRYGPYEN